MFNSAKRVVHTLQTVYLPDFAGPAQAIQWGPFLVVPAWTEGQNIWPSVFSFVVGPFGVAQNTAGEVKVMLASQVADFMALV